MKTGTMTHKVLALAFGAVAAATMMTTPAMAADFHREAQLPAVQRTQPQNEMVNNDFELPVVQKTQPKQDFHFRSGMELPAVQKTQPKVESATGDLDTPVVAQQTLLLPAIQAAREAARSAGETTLGDVVIVKTLDK